MFKNLNKRLMICAGRCVPALYWERQKSASRQDPRLRLGGAMLDNFLNFDSIVKNIHC